MELADALGYAQFSDVKRRNPLPKGPGVTSTGSTKARVPLAIGERLAIELVSGLREYPGVFSRVEIAGSVRRRRPDVGDVEVVAQATSNCRPESVRTVLERLHVRRGEPNKRGAAAPWGERYYRGLASVSEGIEVGVDLFVVLPPAEWGVVFAIRTGSAEFSQACVTRLHRWGLKSDQGRILKVETGETLPCPRESLFFRHARLPWIPPYLRDMGERAVRFAFSREWEPGEELRELADP